MLDKIVGFNILMFLCIEEEKKIDFFDMYKSSENYNFVRKFL